MNLEKTLNLIQSIAFCVAISALAFIFVIIAIRFFLDSVR